MPSVILSMPTKLGSTMPLKVSYYTETSQPGDYGHPCGMPRTTYPVIEAVGFEHDEPWVCRDIVDDGVAEQALAKSLGRARDYDGP